MKKTSKLFLFFVMLSILEPLFSEEYLFLCPYNDELCYISRDKNIIFLNIGVDSERKRIEIKPTPIFKVEICAINKNIYLFNNGQIQIFDSKLSLVKQINQGENLTPALWPISSEGEYILYWNGNTTHHEPYFLISNIGITPIKSAVNLNGFELEERNKLIYLNGNILDNKIFEPISHLGSKLESILQISFFFDGEIFITRGNIINKSGKLINSIPIINNFNSVLKTKDGYLLLSQDNIFLVDLKWNLIEKWDADQPEYIGKLDGNWPLIKADRSISVVIPEKVKIDCLYKTSNRIAGCAFVKNRIWITEKLGYGLYSKKIISIIPKLIKYD